MKFGRSYQMTVVGLSGNLISINFPLTLEFNITHHQFAQSNVADFSIYNLSSTKRSDIACNQFIKLQPRQVILRAGYASQNTLGQLGDPNSLPVIFNGYLNVAYTERSGSNLITRINAFDHGDTSSSKPATIFPNNFSIPANTSFEQMVLQVMGCLRGSGINPGAVQVSNPPPPITRPRPFSGPVYETLVQLSLEAPGTRVFVEQGVCNMVGYNDSLGGNNLGTLTSETGLLGIPKYTGATILASCVFEPALAINKTINLDSTFAPLVNGPCKIIGYTHSGTISGSKSGDAISDIEMQSLNTIAGVA